MKIYYLQFKVKPTKENEKSHLVEGALAHCWIKETNAQNAHVKTEFFVSKSDWEITGIEDYPIEVNESNFSVMFKSVGMDKFQHEIFGF